MYPEGQVQMALPFTGLVSQLEPSLQGLLMQASFRWQSRPGRGVGHQRACPAPAQLQLPRHTRKGLPLSPCRVSQVTGVVPGA